MIYLKCLIKLKGIQHVIDRDGEVEMQVLKKLMPARGTNGRGGIPDKVKGMFNSLFWVAFIWRSFNKNAFFLTSYICKRFRSVFESYLSFQRQIYCAKGYKLEWF